MPFNCKRTSVIGIAAGVLIGGAALLSPLHAEDFAGDVPDRVWIDVGGAANDVSTDVALRGPNGIGATINFEDVFDLPGNKTTARMFGTVRISPKRRWIDFGYVSIDRTGTRVLDADVTFGDYTFQEGAEVAARFSTQFVYAAFRYDFLHEDKIRISGSAGLTFLRVKTGLIADGAAVLDPNGVPVGGGVFNKNASVGAPVPMVGLNLDWALTRRLVLRTYTRFFKLNLDKFNGGLAESGIRLNWYFVRHFGLALGYDRTDLDVKELKVGNGNVLKAGYTVNGIGLFANLAF
jgi:hypothetical protein